VFGPNCVNQTKDIKAASFTPWRAHIQFINDYVKQLQNDDDMKWKRKMQKSFYGFNIYKRYDNVMNGHLKQNNDNVP